MATSSLVRRICKCGCGREFTPPRTRPGQEWLFGHKRKAEPARSESKAPAEDKRRILNYKIALDSASREIGEVEAGIERLDDQVDVLRHQAQELLSRKDVLVERHLALRTITERLEQVLGGAA
jgi:chromosome segregation ATPase